MKIVICNTLYPPDGIGGPERSVKITAEGLVRLGHEVTVVGQALGTATKTQVLNGVKRVSLGSPPGYEPVVADNRGIMRTLKKKVFAPWSGDLLKRYLVQIESEQPDVVQTNVVHSVDKLWEELRRLQFPVVHTLRIYNVMCNQRMYFQGAECRTQCEPCTQRFGSRISASNQVSAVVGISRYVLQRHLDEGYFVDGPRKHVIGNPYDLEVDQSKLDSTSQAVDSKHLLFMGRIHPSKGVRLFAELARNSPSPDLRFRVCGRGHERYEAEIRSVLGTSSRCEWLGFSNHALAFQSVGWLVVPSLWGEPFGRVVIEAFAHGIPVIASNGGAFPELIEHGKNGLLFSTDDPDSLMRIVRKISEDGYDHAAFRAQAFESAKKFTADKIAREYERVFMEVKETN